MTMDQRRLFVFCKYPDAGAVKTRLAKSVGDQSAAQIARQLLELTVKALAPLSAQGVTLILFVAPATRAAAFREWLGDPWIIKVQPEGDLGDRLESAFADNQVDTIVVGSDCPGITAQAVMDAFELISAQQMVFGPTLDGGFYAMGAQQVPKGFFRNIRWSSEVTLKQLLNRAKSAGIEIALLRELYDVDTEADLHRWKSEIAQSEDDAAETRIEPE